MPISDKYPIYYAIKKGKIRVIYYGHHSVISSPEVRFWSRVDMNGPVVYEHLGKCWTWTGSKFKDGYGIIAISGVSTRAHRYSWELHNIESIPRGILVLHKCDNRECVNPNHLFLGTQQDNTDDMCEKGRNKYVVHIGEDNGGGGKLTEEQVMEILNTYVKGDRRYSTTALGKKYGVSAPLIGMIVRGKIWKHIYAIWVSSLQSKGS